MHTMEKKERNIFAEGMQGWKMLFNAVRRKKKPETENQGQTLANANAG